MPSFAYRFETADRRIVISGDTNPSEAVIEACSGCDVMVHEVLTEDRPNVDNQRSRPEMLLEEVTAHYAGHVVVGRDLDVY